MYDCTDINVAANYFSSCLKSVFDIHAPIKTKTVRGKPAPWLNGDLKSYMDKRDKLLRKARKTKNDKGWDEYRQARNKCNAKVKEAKRKYHRHLIEEGKENPHKFWEAVKKVFPSKSKSSPESTAKKSETQSMVNTFSKYFGTIVTELKSKIVSFSNFVWQRNTKGDKRTDNSFSFSYVSRIFVEGQLKALKRRKAACLLYTSPSPRDGLLSRMPSSA